MERIMGKVVKNILLCMVVVVVRRAVERLSFYRR